jgi:hypothetical protein
MDEVINQVARQHEETVQGWNYAEASRVLYGWYDQISARFFAEGLPAPVLSFKRKRGRQLGHYVNGRNEIGVQENINISANHLQDPLADVLETLAHEMVHSWQRNHGKPGKRNYHNAECRKKMDEIGIPCDQWGCGLGMKDPFVSFLREHGVQAEMRLVLPQEVCMAARSSSRLKKWSCGCTNVWAAVRVAARCTLCENGFVLVLR